MPDEISWTMEQLREHITAQLMRIASENRLRLDLLQQEIDRRFDAMQLQLDQRFASSQDAVQAALKSAELAVNKAEVAAEKRFDSVNEFRKTLSDQTKAFVTEDKFSGLVRQVDLMQGQRSGNQENRTAVNANMILVIQVAIALIAIAALVVSIIVHVH